MHDKFKKRHRQPQADDRVRRQIAAEAARRLFPQIGPVEGRPGLGDATESDYYNAKRRAAAVLGIHVRPGDLPTDAEVREHVLAIAEGTVDATAAEGPDEPPRRMGDHLDRFEVYRLRLVPLEGVKQSPRTHPEGDALYHSLQVFGLAKQVRPYDEEFLLAALLHDVGKAIDDRDHVRAGLEALGGTLTERTSFLIQHHMARIDRPDRPLPMGVRREIAESPHAEDLALLWELDKAGRVVGASVEDLDGALAYIRDLARDDEAIEDAP